MTSGSQGDRTACWQLEPWSSQVVIWHILIGSCRVASWALKGCGFLQRLCTVLGAVWKKDALRTWHSTEDGPQASHNGLWSTRGIGLIRFKEGEKLGHIPSHKEGNYAVWLRRSMGGEPSGRNQGSLDGPHREVVVVSAGRAVLGWGGSTVKWEGVNWSQETHSDSTTATCLVCYELKIHVIGPSTSECDSLEMGPLKS